MGKERKSYKTQYKQEDQSEKFGRPIDNDLQIKFMSKVRGAKLQLINAQSELQLQFSFNDITKKSKKLRKKTQDDQLCEDLQKIIIANFKEINADKKPIMLKRYNQLSHSWKFSEVQTIDQLPKYLFEDGNDLSFILHSLNIEKIKKLDQTIPTVLLLKETNPLKTQELFLYGLLCLNGRNHLSYEFIIKVLQRSSLVISLIEYGIKLLQQQLNEKIKRGEPLMFDQQKYNHDSGEENQQFKFNQSKSQQSEQSQKIQKGKKQTPLTLNYLNKRKAIQKKSKNKGQKSLIKCEKNFQSQEIVYSKNASQEDKLQALIQKLVSYIIWSYKYVFDEELKLRSKREKISSQITGTNLVGYTSFK